MKNWFIRRMLFAGWSVYRAGVWRCDTALAESAAALAWRVARREKRCALAQIRACMPDYDSPPRAENLARAMTRHLALAAVELLALDRDRETMLNRVRFAPGALERLEAVWSARRGGLFATGHIGNWELMAAAIAASGPTATIVKGSYDPVLDETLAGIRRRYRIEPISRGAPELGERLKALFAAGVLLGVLIDQDTRTPGVFVPFFGRPAWTTSGAAALAVRHRIPLLVGWIHRDGLDHTIHVEGPLTPDPALAESEQITALTLQATARLEAAIRARPEQWVWFHERWKTRPAEESA